MVSLILTTLCFAAVAAGTYEASAADNTYGAASGPSYGGGVVYGSYGDDSDSHEHKKRIHKLKDLHKTEVYDAEIRYFKHRGEHYAEISCKTKPSNEKKYTWILADSDKKIPDFGLEGTVALAGGINVKFVAKYNHKKWVGNDFTHDEKQKFRRVGCHAGDFQTVIDVPSLSGPPL